MSSFDIGMILLTGVGVGFVGALLGIGGGVLLVPVLVIVFRVPMQIAIAASLLSVVATSSAAASVYLKNHLTNLRLGMTLEMATSTGGILGGLIAMHVGQSFLQYLFSGVLILTSLGMWRRAKDERKAQPPGTHDTGWLGGHYEDPLLKRRVSYDVARLPLGLAVSLLAGGLSGLLGIGGGVIKVPTMVLGMGIPLRAASATSDFMIGVTAIASAYIYYSHHHMDLLVAAPSAMGTFLGSLFGAHWATRIHSQVLTRIFCAILAVTAVEMVLRALGAIS